MEERPDLTPDTGGGAAEALRQFDPKSFFKSWLLPLIAEIAVLLFLFNYVINITYVPSGSMIPTIAEHSVLISLPLRGDTDNLDRGEIYSFYSEELDKTLIKRLIGLPGETVRIEGNGNVYINGERLSEPYVVNQEYGYTGEFVVPEGHYFFLGDNRSGSNDARHWDDPYIPAEEVVSRAVFTVFPFGNFGVLE